MKAVERGRGGGQQVNELVAIVESSWHYAICVLRCELRSSANLYIINASRYNSICSGLYCGLWSMSWWILQDSLFNRIFKMFTGFSKSDLQTEGGGGRCFLFICLKISGGYKSILMCVSLRFVLYKLMAADTLKAMPLYVTLLWIKWHNRMHTCLFKQSSFLL